MLALRTLLMADCGFIAGNPVLVCREGRLPYPLGGGWVPANDRAAAEVCSGGLDGALYSPLFRFICRYQCP